MSPDRFEIDHIIPRSRGGTDDVDNLALACRRCNQRRYNFTTGTDSETQTTKPLFNPRLQQWSEHFIWTSDGLKILGITAIGRATCNRLDFNDDFHDDDAIQTARRFWIEGGWHPPLQDPRSP